MHFSWISCIPNIYRNILLNINKNKRTLTRSPVTTSITRIIPRFPPAITTCTSFSVSYAQQTEKNHSVFWKKKIKLIARSLSFLNKTYMECTFYLESLNSIIATKYKYKNVFLTAESWKLLKSFTPFPSFVIAYIDIYIWNRLSWMFWQKLKKIIFHLCLIHLGYKFFTDDIKRKAS